MTVYQITIQSFFNSHNTDYAMPVDRYTDVILFKKRTDADEKFNELIDEYVNRYWEKNGHQSNEFLHFGANNCTVIYHDKSKTNRTYISLDPKELN